MPQQQIAFSTYPHSIPLFAGGVRLINLYPEKAEGPARTQFALMSCPGMKSFSDVTTVANTAGNECRGFHWFDSESTLYAVIGSYLVTIGSDGTPALIDSNIAGTGPVTMVSDFDQMLIITAPGTDDYLWDGSTISQLTGPNIVDWRDVAIIDGYAVLVQNTPSVAGRFSWTDTNALATVTATSFANAESSPDSLLRILKVGRLLWLLGSDSIEPWYSTGDSSSPFERHANIMRQIGIGAENSRASLPAASEDGRDKGFFLGISKQSRPSVYMLGENGEVARVSTNALDRILGDNTYSDARGFTYAVEGHDFYCLTLPTADRCFVFDASLGAWHERQSGVKEVAGWNARQCIVAHNKVLVGDVSDGKIYELDNATHTDASSSRLAMFVAQMQSSGEYWNFLDEILLDITVGEAANNASTEPQVIMQLSKDGGQNFGDERWRGIGFGGDYDRQAKWHGNGRFRTCLAKFKITDSVVREVAKVHAHGRAGRPV